MRLVQKKRNPLNAFPVDILRQDEYLFILHKNGLARIKLDKDYFDILEFKHADLIPHNKNVEYSCMVDQGDHIYIVNNKDKVFECYYTYQGDFEKYESSNISFHKGCLTHILRKDYDPHNIKLCTYYSLIAFDSDSYSLRTFDITKPATQLRSEGGRADPEDKPEGNIKFNRENTEFIDMCLSRFGEELYLMVCEDKKYFILVYTFEDRFKLKYKDRIQIASSQVIYCSEGDVIAAREHDFGGGVMHIYCRHYDMNIIYAVDDSYFRLYHEKDKPYELIENPKEKITFVYGYNRHIHEVS